jgi:cytochrome P450
MSPQDVSDELLTLLGAGHETTASTLGWAFERLRRHPDIVAKLVEENDEGGNEFRQATIQELQRNRTVIDFSGRHVQAPHFDLGDWRIPHGYTVMIAIANVHANADVFPDPERFDPYRFVGTRAPTAWVPFGGGTRRCIGAAFANVEMDVVLRTVLRHFVIETDDAPGEKIHFRGIAFTPKDGGLITVRRRETAA